ncbi:MAG: long-chain fatty acid--CoA ligase, partial [Deltaproteobacteria bacterium]|nr:long-chain fatty acid--CoA ligase [Deltaproteobacteria bacterium]
PIYHSTLPKDVAYILNHCQAEIAFIEGTSQLAKISSLRSELSYLKKIISFDKVSQEEVFPFKKIIKDTPFHLENFQALIGAIDLKDLATVVYTSGTTGQPKGVALTHECFSSEIDALNQIFDLSEGKESLLFLPLAHILARALQFYQLTQGFIQAYAESIDKLLENIKEIKPHFMVSVPRIFEKIYAKVMGDFESAPFYKKEVFKWAVALGKKRSRARQNHQSFSMLDQMQYQVAQRLVFSKLHERLGGRLEFFISGGAPLSQEIGEFFDAANILILEGYGLTETTAAITCNKLDRYRFGTVGPIVANVEIKLARDKEILVRGAHVCKGYYRNEEATQESFTPDGFFKTGDIGEFDDKGFLRITDRKKDLIVTAAGKNIAPQYIENLLKTDAVFSQVMVHGDRRKFLSALVTLNPDALQELARVQNLGSFDYQQLVRHPKIFEMVKKRIEEKNKQLASYESIKRFSILADDFTIDRGELTPTLKIKRKVVSEKYKGILDSFYQE